MADKDLLYFNQTSAQWELINSGAISDGTNTITPNKIGLLTSLTSSDKSSIVASLNETRASLTALKGGSTRTLQDIEILTLMGAI